MFVIQIVNYLLNLLHLCRKRKLPQTEESNVSICLSPKTVAEYVSTYPDAEICLELGSSVSSMQSTPNQSPSTRLQNLTNKLEKIDVEGFDLEHIRGIGEEQEEEREEEKPPEILVEIVERGELSPDATGWFNFAVKWNSLVSFAVFIVT